jgi:ABC-type sugar transport system permease subunit
MTAAPGVSAPALPRPQARASRGNAHRRDWLAAFLFLAPFLVINIVFLIWPLIRGVWISLHDWDLMDDDIRIWIGTLNYQDLWSDPTFWRAARNTLWFVTLTVPSMTVVALLLALAVHGGGRPPPWTASARRSATTVMEGTVRVTNQSVFRAARQKVGSLHRSW